MNGYFNPHEREARDWAFLATLFFYKYFNPHEREARDQKPLPSMTTLTKF